MTIDAAACRACLPMEAPTTDDDAPDQPLGYSAAGGPARMAALQLLAGHPAGVRSAALRDAIRQADARVFDEMRMQAVLQALRRAGLADTEMDAAGRLRWFSPGARHTARVRGTWPPANEPAGPPTSPNSPITSTTTAPQPAATHTA